MSIDLMRKMCLRDEGNKKEEEEKFSLILENFFNRFLI